MAAEPRPDDELFRWQGLLQRSSDGLFLLNRRRRLLFANHACEQLTGHALAQMRGRACRRHRHAEPGSWEAVANALAPPPEVLQDRTSRARRLFVGANSDRAWWDVEFLPLAGQEGLLAILGKVRVVSVLPASQAAALPEKLLGIRERLAERFVLQADDSAVLAWRRLGEQVRLAAQTRTPVLLVGEPGVGKYWLARVIHRQGKDRERTFARLDCAGLPATVLANLLFGPQALTRRASVGTLYLRNVAALPRELQTRLGDGLIQGEPDRPRLIAGLACDPAEEVQAGRLLDELGCALGTLLIAIPPPRERLADLPGVIDCFLERARPPGSKKGLTPPALELLAAYPWPGNLHELYAVLSSAHDKAAAERIGVPDLPGYVRRALDLQQLPARTAVRPLPLDPLLEQIERRLIVLALRMADGNKSKAADLLAIWRPRLLRRMEALGIPGSE